MMRGGFDTQTGIRGCDSSVRKTKFVIRLFNFTQIRLAALQLIREQTLDQLPWAQLIVPLDQNIWRKRELECESCSNMTGETAAIETLAIPAVRGS